MFDRLPLAASVSVTPKSPAALPVSLTAHGLLVLALGIAAFFAVGPIPEPRVSSSTGPFIVLLPGPKAVAAPLPQRGSAEPRPIEVKREMPVEKLPEMIQPEIIPEEIPPSEALDAPGDESGIDGGHPEGLPGGDINGIPGGIPFGDPNGVLGGSPDGVPGGVGPGMTLPSDDIVLISGDVRPPVLTDKVQPEYPVLARRVRVEGKVILEIVVDLKGRVADVIFLKSDPLFDFEALDAVKKWRYEPATLGGRPVKVRMTVVVDFRLK